MKVRLYAGDMNLNNKKKDERYVETQKFIYLFIHLFICKIETVTAFFLFQIFYSPICYIASTMF